MFRKQFLVGLVVAAVISWGASARAVVVNNPSFETDTFTVWPGYISGNGPITGWAGVGGVGLNPAGGSPFADNGAVPDGVNVAFIQGQNNTVSQTITGLVPGETYRVSYRYNDRNGAQARLKVTMGGTVLQDIPNNYTQVGGTNPYYYSGYEFTAGAASDTLTFQNTAPPGDTTVLVDQVSITPAGSDGLTTANWTGDGDAGVSPAWNYTAAANFGSTDGLAINGVTFAGTTNGGNPAGAGFTATGLTARFGGDVNNLTVAGGGSATLARDFNYNGNPATVTFTGLTAGRRYVGTLYTVGWEGTGRKQILSDGSGAQVTIDQDVHGNDNGLRLTFTYTADAPSKTFSFTPYGGSLHVYGVSNRQNFLAWDVAGPADWHTGSNWDAEDNATTPSAGVDAVIDNGGTANLSGGTASAASLEIGGTTGGALVHTGGTLDVPIIKLGSGGTLQANGLGGNTGASGFTFDGGTLRAGASFTTTVPMSLDAGGGTVDTNGFNPKVNGMISGPGALTKTGAGTMELTGTNSYSGGTTVSHGDIRIGNAAALGSGDVSVANGANVLLWFNTGSNTIANNFTLNGMGSVGGKDAIYADGGGAGAPIHTLTGTITLNATSNVGGNNLNHLNFTGQITGPGGLTKGGTRTDENNIVTLFNTSNDYAGDTTVVKGRLRLGASEVIPDGAGKGNVTVNSGTVLDLGSYNETINGLYGGGTVVFSGVPTGPVYFTTDGGTDISTSKTYTHLLDFNAGASVATINGVAFTNAGTSGANWSLNTTAGTANTSTGMIPPSGGMHTLLEDFYYNGNTLTVTGLTPGVAYETRLYNRRWGGDRYQEITFDEDGAGPASTVIGFDEDASATPSYLGYRFTAVSDTLTVQFAHRTGTYHFYGLTNEEVASPTIPVFTVSGGDFSGTIVGPGRLVKQGAGQLRLTGASTYSGGTTIADGIVRIDHAQALGSGPVSVADGASFMIWAPGAMTVANDIVLNGMGPGPLRPALNQDGGAGLVTLTGTVTLAATSDIGVGGSSSNDLMITGKVTGPGGLVVDQASSGSGWSRQQTLILTANNDYSGGTTVTGGALRLGHANAASTGDINVAGGANVLLWFNTGSNTIANNFTLNGMGGSPAGYHKSAIYGDGGGAGFGEYVLSGQVTLNADGNIGGHAGNNIRVTGQITGPGGLTKGSPFNDHSTLFLDNGNNDYSGVTTFTNGIVNAAQFSDYGVDGSLGNRALADDTAPGGNIGLLFRGGTLQYTGSTPQSTNRAIRVSTTGGGGTIDASGSDPSATLSFTAAASPNFWENGGTRTLTLTGSNTGDNTFAMAIQDLPGVTTTHLTKSGAGTWIVSGNNNYNGVTNVNAGVLRITNSNALGIGGFSAATWTLLTTGAALELEGTWSLGEHMHINGAGIGGTGALRSLSGTQTLTQHIALDGPTTIGVEGGATLINNAQFYDVGSLTKVGDGTLVVNSASPYGGATVVEAGTLLVNGSLLNTASTTVNGGMLGGNGTVNGPVTINPGGAVSAGVSPGHFFINGTYAQTGTMLVEIEGYGQGTDYDYIEVTGGNTATVDGIVEVMLGGGFAPASGSVFEVLTADSVVEGVYFQLDTTLAPLLPAQYWIASFPGQSLQLSIGVPEPSTLVLAALGLLGLMFVGRRRRR